MNCSVPRRIRDQIRYPEFLSELAPQRNQEESCGTCKLRNILTLDFGHERSERHLYELKKQVSGKGIVGGTSPEEIAGIAKLVGNNGLAIKLKSFLSNHGDLRQLNWLRKRGVTPMIYRYWYKEPSKGHWELFIGADSSDVYLFDGRLGRETSGIYTRDRDYFMREWWPNGRASPDDIRSYLAVVPETFQIPFRGITLGNHFRKS